MNIVTIDSADTPQYTSEVEYLLGGLPRVLYDDGTKQFVSMNDHSKVYSPRLNKADLETFCEKHIDKYRTFRIQNEYLILMGQELPPINQFWNQ